MELALLSASEQPANLSAWRLSATLAILVLMHLVGGAALLVAFAGAYTVKRHLALDVVFRVDMLPDTQIEAAIRAVVILLSR
jgi:hypothetical protein